MADRTFSADYLAGVSVAMTKLAEWEHSLPTPTEMAVDIKGCIFGAPIDQRTGFSETLAAYLICCMGGARPLPGRWNVVEDLGGGEGDRP